MMLNDLERAQIVLSAAKKEYNNFANNVSKYLVLSDMAFDEFNNINADFSEMSRLLFRNVQSSYMHLELIIARHWYCESKNKEDRKYFWDIMKRIREQVLLFEK